MAVRNEAVFQEERVPAKFISIFISTEVIKKSDIFLKIKMLCILK